MNRRLREFHWNLIKKTVCSEEILTSIRLLEGNRFLVQTTTWENYWGENVQYLPCEFQTNLHHLKETEIACHAVADKMQCFHIACSLHNT